MEHVTNTEVLGRARLNRKLTTIKWRKISYLVHILWDDRYRVLQLHMMDKILGKAYWVDRRALAAVIVAVACNTRKNWMKTKYRVRVGTIQRITTSEVCHISILSIEMKCTYCFLSIYPRDEGISSKKTLLLNKPVQIYWRLKQSPNKTFRFLFILHVVSILISSKN